MPVELRNDQRLLKLETRKIKKIGQSFLAAVRHSDAVLSVFLTDDRAMAQLHGRWMGEPSPTDVLSFSMEESAGNGAKILGDIAISVETAMRRNPQDPSGEVVDYFIHGLLHLVGFDHLRRADRQRMDQEARRLKKIAQAAC